MIQREDIVVVAFPYVRGGGGKSRPALVIQCNGDNQRLSNTIVAMITGNIRYAETEPTQLLIDPSTRDGQSSGLSYPSAVKCGNLYTVDQRDILTTIGRLPASAMAQIESRLKAALELPQHGQRMCPARSRTYKYKSPTLNRPFHQGTRDHSGKSGPLADRGRTGNGARARDPRGRLNRRHCP